MLNIINLQHIWGCCHCFCWCTCLIVSHTAVINTLDMFGWSLSLVPIPVLNTPFIRILVKEECLRSGIVCTPDNRSILPRTFRHIRQTSRGVVRVVMWLQSIITLVANVYQGIQHYNRKTMLVRFSPKTGSRRLCCNTLLISIHLESMSRRRCIRMMNTLHVSFLSWNCCGRVWLELAHQNVKGSRCDNVLKGKWWWWR